MHELSIALAILSTVEDIATRERARKVRKVRLKIGVLSLIDVDALMFALRVASKGTVAEGAELEVELVHPVFKCRKCGYKWSLSTSDVSEIVRKASPFAHIYPEVIVQNLACPRCGHSDIEVVEGTQVIVHSVELEF